MINKLGESCVYVYAFNYFTTSRFSPVGSQIHFFAHLSIAGVIDAPSMLSLLQSFAVVLDEPGVSYGRGLNAGLCVAEALMRV